MWNLIGGLAIWSIGLVGGDSVFYGDFSILTIAFDAAGTFFVGRGLWELYEKKKSSKGDQAAPH